MPQPLDYIIAYNFFQNLEPPPPSQNPPWFLSSHPIPPPHPTHMANSIPGIQGGERRGGGGGGEGIERDTVARGLFCQGRDSRRLALALLSPCYATPPPPPPKKTQTKEWDKG